MIRLAIITTTLAFSTNAFGARAVTCNIESLADAQRCMEKVAKSRPDYEEPNDALTTDLTDRLAQALKVLGVRDRVVERAQKADFAGLMIEHGDEHHIYYFALNKGRNVKPVELHSFNVVDLQYNLEKPYSPAALNHETYFLGIAEARDIDAYEDVAEQIRYMLEQGQN